MKLLTLNTHSLVESEYEAKLNHFVKAIIKYDVDIIALQEIMQPINANMCKYECINAGEIPLKQGNHGLNIVNKLLLNGRKYNFAWLGFKKSYDKFDEGIVLLSKDRIEESKVITLTPFDEYSNWKTRKALGIKVNKEWFFSVHFGWEESFEYEFNQMHKELPRDEKCWILGDFNTVASERNKGYDLVISSGIYDTYSLAKNKDDGYTANTGIDGWDEKNNKRNIRIDYIFVTKKTEIESSFVIFNGSNEPIVSDHYGILLRVEEK